MCVAEVQCRNTLGPENRTIGSLGRLPTDSHSPSFDWKMCRRMEGILPWKKKDKKFSWNPFQRKTNLIFWKANRHLAEWMKLKQMMSVEHKMIHPRWMDVRRSWNGTGHFDGGCLFLFKISINLIGASWIIFRRLVRHFPPFSTDLQKYQFQSNLLFV